MPGDSAVGEMLVSVGGIIVKFKELLQPAWFTYALPPTVPVGTIATICVSLQLTTEMTFLFCSDMYPLPWVEPNADPVSVTCIPGDNAVGEMLVSVGAE
jgi:hypothetical protein